ncbi:MAG: hypothetical protein HY869_03940 [Chloroflexi bacterium]|nr:hypothetical protein [Chloroflexota bacterium]
MTNSSHITPSGGLFTHHFVEAIQQASFNHPAAAAETFGLQGMRSLSAGELEKQIAAAWELLTERWDSVGRGLGAMTISEVRERWIRPLCTLLEFDLEYQRADLVLEEDLRFSISYLGRPVAVNVLPSIPVHSVAAGADLDARQANAGRGLKGLAPHDLLQRYLNLNREMRWGLLTNGLRLRLLRDYHHTSQRGYVEFDLEGIFETRDFAAFRALYRMCHVSRFQLTGGASTSETQHATPLELFYQHSQATGVKVGEDLRGNVRLAIERLANGFLQSTPGLLARMSEQTEPVHYPEIGDLPPVQAFFHDVLTIIYRMLFLLFAEQRGMLPGRGSLYADEFSIVALRKRAERPVMEDEHLDLWERLLTTFRMVEKGAPELGVFGYNGALFGADRTPTLNQIGEGNHAALRNDALLRAVQSLTTINRDGVLQLISYLDLSVEEIGSIYESLLDFTPRIVTGNETLRISEDSKGLNPGEFFLDARGSTRKTTGSYYTHPALVNQEVQSALVPVLMERLRAAVPAFDENQVEALSEAERKKAEAAVLGLRVLDPAAGSGAFLISAMNVLALMLARIRAGDFYPAEREIRRARRDVLAHCLYAVDYNPMAVELCKVSLWINAAVEDAPLNFLDHHIKFGNSLVGVPPLNGTARASDSPEADSAARFPNLPDEAFTPVADDDKKLARSARDDNRKARDGQLMLWQMTQVETPEDLGAWSELTQLAEDDPKAAEARYLSLLETDDFQRRKLAADLWTAAFFWSFTPDGVRAPTTQSVRQAQVDPKILPADMVQTAQKLTNRYRFFHWGLEFEDVFSQNSGFDVILGNPPWERLNLEEQQFFEALRPDIAKLSTSQRKKVIQELAESSKELFAEFLEAKRDAELEIKFSLNSGGFGYSTQSRLNTYALFVEQGRHLINNKGMLGMIVPSGIATDMPYKDLFESLISGKNLVSLFDFENRLGLFPSVDRRFKFCLLTLQTGNTVVSSIKFAFFLNSVEDLNSTERVYSLSQDDLFQINPITKTSPVFRNSTDAILAKKIYNNFPTIFDENGKPRKGWKNADFLIVFRSDSKSDLYRTRTELEQEGFSISNELNFVKDDLVYLPIYEAKQIHQFDFRYSTYSGLSQQDKDNGNAQVIENNEKDNVYLAEPRYWALDREIIGIYKNRNWVKSWTVGYRDITNATNERTAIASIMPFVGSSQPMNMFIGCDAEAALLWVCAMNSLVCDYVVRQKVGGTHLNITSCKQLPIPAPVDIPDEIKTKIINLGLELTYTSPALKGFAQELGYHGEPFKWDESRRAQVRAELDAYYARLYGLTRDELRYILDPKEVHGADFPGETFRVLKDKEERLYGEYRTSRLVLGAWDAVNGLGNG